MLKEKFDVINFKKGEIRFEKDNDVNKMSYKSHIQNSFRPVLIMSSDEYLTTNPSIVQVIPISSRSVKYNDKNYIYNVSFTNNKGEINYILCNQMRTISISALSNESFGTLSNEKMREVNDIVSMLLNLNNESLLTYKKIEEKLLTLIDSKMKERESFSQFINSLDRTVDQYISYSDKKIQLKLSDQSKDHPNSKKSDVQSPNTASTDKEENLYDFLKDDDNTNSTEIIHGNTNKKAYFRLVFKTLNEKKDFAEAYTSYKNGEITYDELKELYNAPKDYNENNFYKKYIKALKEIRSSK